MTSKKTDALLILSSFISGLIFIGILYIHDNYFKNDDVYSNTREESIECTCTEYQVPQILLELDNPDIIPETSRFLENSENSENSENLYFTENLPGRDEFYGPYENRNFDPGAEALNRDYLFEEDMNYGNNW